MSGSTCEVAQRSAVRGGWQATGEVTGSPVARPVLRESRALALAAFLDVGASRMKPAPGGWVRGTRNVSDEAYVLAVPLERGVGDEHRLDEGPGVGVKRPLVER